MKTLEITLTDSDWAKVQHMQAVLPKNDPATVEEIAAESIRFMYHMAIERGAERLVAQLVAEALARHGIDVADPAGTATVAPFNNSQLN